MSDNIRRFERRKKQDGAPQITPAPDPSMPAFTSNDGMPDWANPSNGGLDDADMIPPRWMNRGMGSIAPSRDTQPGADAFPDPSEIVAPITRALETNLEILEVVRAEFLKAEERFQDSLRQIRGDVEQLKRSSTEQP
ncbi:MAG TPA: hypothetical protein PL033_12230 [Candidatus Brocadiia bacterium]|nr:hypothetical protein [Candidatus Brocadiia bacterium]